jgi:hypothetical protein
MGKRRKIPVVQPDPVRTLHGSFPVATLDLHGLYAEPAMAKVRTFLSGWGEREPGAVVRIISGKGTHSEGAPVLRGRLLEGLNGALAPWVEDWASEVGGGSYVVRVRRGRDGR